MKRHEAIAEDMREKLPVFLTDNGILCSIRNLAEFYGASQQTICKSLNLLVHRGSLERLENHGGFVAPGKLSTGNIISETTPAYHRKTWQTVAEALNRNISAGQFELDASLPPLNILADRFGCSYRTIKKALAELTNKHFLERKGRSYYPSIHAGYRSRTAPTYIVVDTDVTRKTNETIQFILQTLEISFLTARWNPPIVVHYERLTPHEMGECGFSICISREPYNWFESFNRTYPGIPKVCIDISERHAQLPIPDPRNLLIVSPDNAAFGAKVGRYLRSLGHRRIAVFSDRKGKLSQWRSRRLEGIGRIYPFGSSDGPNARLFEPVKKPESAEAASSFDALLQNGISSLPGGLGDALDSRLAVAGSIACITDLYERLKPLFVEAIEDAGITAWVGTIDEVALLAYAFLRHKGISVPGRIALVGFDDSPDAVQWDITSCDTGKFESARLSFSWLTSPSSETGHVRTTGAIVERGTTIPVRNSLIHAEI